MVHRQQRRSKRFFLTTSLVICGIVLAVYGSLALRTNTSHTYESQPILTENEENPVQIPGEAIIRYGVPIKLSIDTIEVNSEIHPVGLTPDGDMNDPDTNEITGWYKYGARPGNEGTAVIAGHYGLRGDAVFGKLNSLKIGDTISVLDDRDQTVSFIVREIRSYSYDEAPSEVFTSTSGAHLNLITCEGDWNSNQDTFAERLVIFTDKVEDNFAI